MKKVGDASVLLMGEECLAAEPYL